MLDRGLPHSGDVSRSSLLSNDNLRRSRLRLGTRLRCFKMSAIADQSPLRTDRRSAFIAWGSRLNSPGSLSLVVAGNPLKKPPLGRVED